LAIVKPRGEHLSGAERELLENLASQAGLALRNARLAVELQARLEQISAQAKELVASRRRIIAAQDHERRRLERDIHDGAQQHLVGMAARLRTASQLIETDPARAAKLLDEVTVSMSETVVALRDLARGIFPQVLADKGLYAALRTQLTKSFRGARLKTSAPLAGVRCDPRVEAAAYFCCLEALQNAAKHAPDSRLTLTLDMTDDWLTFSVADDGPGLPTAATSGGTGIQNMTDRLAAVGGTLHIESTSDGVTVTGRVPRQPDAEPGAEERLLADAR
ncbi:MAG: sensor histidine kinase, partial [Mycobacteriales bacterium]